ncbi:RcnB family protein [Pseudomonas seleniipraecipitans]|jgi:Ni/Co efflux regulator RcnB|uniref:Nickel/cobalt transporter regulator n=1 Tax=Phytopseudomonas seleniipraecipitans TaxID=640205 RepID=A0A1G7G619_9GAMM|nr:RcnB family protein [Pseudomonas seleniipraecipitans]UUD63206.1 RcnB family protein [Pseudomonas seleniipraecipitans]SDE83525.1 Nickel/cobalt transporter regulator [Pseudomonas seleniipraecipitans]
MKTTPTLSVLFGALLMTGLAHAADPAKQEPAREVYQDQVLQQQPDQEDPEAKDPMHIGHLKEGTPAPHKYWRDDYAIKDLKKHDLPEPEDKEHEHWVKIGTDYVLLNNNTGTIQRIIKAK